ncbi:MAG TPA: metalloregulator ArsR/SmtB family transcription factor [Pseudobacteroides sp.]|nr:metalloregulator ArsR/SmtB family transcription factor [Pseudobacteroides sp.]
MEDLKKFEIKAEKLKVISHPQRLCIVKGLIGNHYNVSKIQESLGLPQSTVSQHIAKLRTAGIIEGKRNGLEICYKVVDNEIVDIINVLFNS